MSAVKARARAVAKALRSRILDSPSAMRARSEREARQFVALRVAEIPQERTHLLLAPPGAGNIGDQAMVEAFVENVAGPVTIILRSQGDVDMTSLRPLGARAEALPTLTGAGIRRDMTDLRRFKQLLSAGSSFSVVGADTMDGGYTYRGSVQRASLAVLAAQMGVDARVLGFSWNAAPDPRARDALTRAGAAGVRLFLRDPLSLQRAQADGLPNAVASADLVFSARSVDESVRERLRLAPGDDFALVNVSGLIGRRFDQIADYLEILDALLGLGLRVVLIPHVSREGGDDIIECSRLLRARPDPRVQLVDHLLTPPEVRGLVKAAKIVVTGRMHLAIMALWSGVPPLTLATQGKVEGLMEMFAAPSLAVEPRPGFGSEARRVLEQVHEQRESWRGSLASRLSAVRRLSSANFDGLSQTAETTAV